MPSAPTLRVAVAVSSDLVTDQRVDKVARTLAQLGYAPTVVGRASHRSLTSRPYPTYRLPIWPAEGPGFYASLNLQLVRWLLPRKWDLLTANDLDTLPACVLVATLKRIPLVYDSHEYFTGVPELRNRPTVRRIWQWLERQLLPRVSAGMTVNRAVANQYRTQYGVDLAPIYNYPHGQPAPTQPLAEPPVALYQGALQHGRGLERLLEAWQHIHLPAELWLVGDGYLRTTLERLATNPTPNPIRLLGALPFEQLPETTARATVGLSLEDTSAPNSALSSPNKVFDYLQARVPILVTARPELTHLLAQHPVGYAFSTPLPTATELADQLSRYLRRGTEWQVAKHATESAAHAYRWETQVDALGQVYAAALAQTKKA